MHLNGIDAVRAFSALSVVFAHLLGPSLPGYSRYIFTGHPAVIVFFVVSGFCIHFPFKNKSLNTFNFIKRRYTRILLPTLVAYLLAQIMGIRVYNPWDGYILWSVVCELIYYTLYPLFLLLARKIGWNALIIVSIFASYMIVVILGSDENGSAHIYGPYLNWLVALPTWLLGCWLAENFRTDAKLGNVWFWRLTIALTASVLYWSTLNTPFGYYLTMVPFGFLAAGCGLC